MFLYWAFDVNIVTHWKVLCKDFLKTQGKVNPFKSVHGALLASAMCLALSKACEVKKESLCLFLSCFIMFLPLHHQPTSQPLLASPGKSVIVLEGSSNSDKCDIWIDSILKLCFHALSHTISQWPLRKAEKHTHTLLWENWGSANVTCLKFGRGQAQD